MEAEWFTSSAGTFLVGSDTNRSNGQYMYTVDGSSPNSATTYLNYEVDVTNGGSFYLFMLSTGPNGSSDSFWVSVDGGADDQFTTGSNGTWVWKRAEEILQLGNGTHTIRVKAREDGAQVDKLVLTKVNTAPTGLGGTALTPSQRP